MPNAAVVECYATLVDPFGSTVGRDTPHRGADYRRAAGLPVVAYETCTVVNSDLKSSFLGYSVVAKRHRDGKFIGWAHLRVGTRPANGTVLQPGDSVGLVAGYNDFHGSSWSGPHIHTTEGSTAEHIYQGTNTDPAPDIAAARTGTTPGTGTGAINYHWYQLTPAAMGAMQKMLNALKIYGGVEGATGPVDNDFGKLGVKGMQELGKRWGYLAGDYAVDGVPHNPDQEAPSNYGFFLQRWAKVKAGYPGKEDGLPGALTSEYIVKACDKVIAESVTAPTPKPPEPIITIPPLPPCPEGFVFFPDLGTTQGDFDFAEYKAKGGRHVGLKFGGSNASDSPYIAPRYQDQLQRARAQAQKILHYYFNGAKNGLTPTTSAQFFAKNLVLQLGEIVAIDVEHETDSGTVAWTPNEVVEFILELRKTFPGICGVVYMSDSMADAGEWDAVVALGWELWSASWGDNDGDPNVPPVTDDWPYYTAWQYTSEEKVPGNYSGNPKVYLRTDGNLARANMWDRLGWKLPVPTPDPEPEPEPEPTPPGEFVPVSYLTEYLKAQSQLNAEFAAALNK